MGYQAVWKVLEEIIVEFHITLYNMLHAIVPINTNGKIRVPAAKCVKIYK